MRVCDPLTRISVSAPAAPPHNQAKPISLLFRLRNAALASGKAWVGGCGSEERRENGFILPIINVLPHTPPQRYYSLLQIDMSTEASPISAGSQHDSLPMVLPNWIIRRVLIGTLLEDRIAITQCPGGWWGGGSIRSFCSPGAFLRNPYKNDVFPQ
ncbi:hypothetical protein LZ31DRAFT_348991 [Colletotrichum somersetense]|nr:hypothetical protein LZ31DRAFT_348991 [Colletotrichum somersetense]